MESPSLLLAFGAGLLSFLSPCVLPLFPVYLSYLTGVNLAAVPNASERARTRRLVISHALAFMGGFSLVFLALGFAAQGLSALFAQYQGQLRWIGGLLTVTLGLSTLGVLRLPILQREARVQLRAKPAGYLGSALVGLTFAAGWTPCIGPILASILMLAASSEAGVLLLSAYTLGFALPFLALAWGLGNWNGLKRHSRRVELAGGVLLVAIGLLLATDSLSRFSQYLVSITGFQGF